MNKVVYKVQLPCPGALLEVDLRIGATFLHVGLQNTHAFLWFDVDPEIKETRTYEFTCVGTGWAFENKNHGHIGTVVDEANYVWHYYYRILE